jgi:hypothetical protein
MTIKQLGPYPNIQVEYSEEYATPEWEDVSLPIRKFLMVVAAKYPHYKFCFSYSSSFIRVYDGAEQVGQVVYRTDVNKFSFSNFRIKGVRKRGDQDIKTGKLSEAVKVFDRYFYSLSAADVMREDVGAIEGCTKKSLYTTHLVGYELVTVIGKVKGYLISNWETFSEGMVAAGVLSEDDAMKIITLREEAALTGSMTARYNGKSGYHVYIKDNCYYVRTLKTAEAVRHTTETLPDHIKRDVGLLKMVPDNTFVANVGVRRQNDSFYVLGEEK